MKKIAAVIVSVILAASLFAGCSGDAPSASSTSSTSSTSSASSVGSDSTSEASSAEEGYTLSGKTVGVQLGTTGDSFVTDVEGATVERYNKGFEAVQALKQGKIDAVLIDDQPAQVFVAENDDLKILDEPFAVEDYAIAVAKGNTELKDSMNQAIAELREEGTLQKILDYYIGGVEGSSPYQSPEGITYDGQLIMATNAEFPPYESYDGDQIVGIDVDFARAICDKLGKELVIEDMAFDSIIAAISSGKADFGAAGMTVTEDRLENVDFTDSYCTGVQVIIVKK